MGDGILDFERHVRDELGGRKQLGTGHPLMGRRRILPRQQRIKRRAQGINVGTFVSPRPHHLFGRAEAISRSPAQGPGHRLRHGFLGNPEIDQHDPLVLVQQDIVRLEVTMDDGRVLAVQIHQDLAQLAHPREQLFHGHAPVRVLLALTAQGPAPAKLQRQVDHAVRRPAFDDVGYGGMVESAEQRGFILVEQHFRHFLQRPALAAQLQVVHQVGRAETPLAQH